LVIYKKPTVASAMTNSNVNSISRPCIVPSNWHAGRGWLPAPTELSGPLILPMTVLRRTSTPHLSACRRLDKDVNSEEGVMKLAFRIESM
jgi:hypothetical protein